MKNEINSSQDFYQQQDTQKNRIPKNTLSFYQFKNVWNIAGIKSIPTTTFIQKLKQW